MPMPDVRLFLRDGGERERGERRDRREREREERRERRERERRESERDERERGQRERESRESRERAKRAERAERAVGREKPSKKVGAPPQQSTQKAETEPTAVSFYAAPKLSVQCYAAREHAGDRGGANCIFVKTSAQAARDCSANW